MNSNQKLSYAIAAILSGSGLGLGLAHAADTDTADTEGIQEITVTAQRRSESIQDVPITIQAISGDTLKQLNVQTFDDLLKYTPNVTYSGNNPGGGNIYMRGLSSGGTPGQSQSTTAPFPNVGVYLDDQSLQYPARNLDVYLVDMERVEVLEGPQGTLFGGGAKPAPFATSPTSRNSMSPRATSTQVTASPHQAEIRIPQHMPRSICR